MTQDSRNSENVHFDAAAACIVPLVRGPCFGQTQHMLLEVPIPESLRSSLERGVPDLCHAALEGVAVMGYRSGALSLAQVRELMGLSNRWEAQDFLATMGAWPSYDESAMMAELAPLPS